MIPDNQTNREYLTNEIMRLANPIRPATYRRYLNRLPFWQLEHKAKDLTAQALAAIQMPHEQMPSAATKLPVAPYGEECVNIQNNL